MRNVKLILPVLMILSTATLGFAWNALFVSPSGGRSETLIPTDPVIGRTGGEPAAAAAAGGPPSPGEAGTLRHAPGLPAATTIAGRPPAVVLEQGRQMRVVFGGGSHAADHEAAAPRTQDAPRGDRQAPRVAGPGSGGGFGFGAAPSIPGQGFDAAPSTPGQGFGAAPSIPGQGFDAAPSTPAQAPVDASAPFGEQGMGYAELQEDAAIESLSFSMESEEPAVAHTPEPSTLLLFAGAMLAGGFTVYRRRSA